MTSAELITACENVCRDFAWVLPVTEWLRNLAIPVGVWVGLYQLGTWRREKVALKRAEIAETIMSSALVVDDLLNSVRNVYLRIEPKSSYAEQIFARWKKYDDGWDKITRLQDMRPKAEAFFDDEDVLSDVEQLLKALGETQATLLTLQGHEPDTTYGMDQETIEFYRDLRSLVRKKDGDKIDVLQRKAMDSLKRKLYPVMRLEKG